MKAEGGLVNGMIAIDYVLAAVPEVDPSQLYACGHSSAAVVAVNLAAADSRIRACCAYAPRTDVEAWWNDPKMEKVVSEFAAFATQHSPLRHVNGFNCPVFLFHADDDSMVPLSDNLSFARAMRAAGKDLTLDRVSSGDHYDSMIQRGNSSRNRVYGTAWGDARIPQTISCSLMRKGRSDGTISEIGTASALCNAFLIPKINCAANPNGNCNQSEVALTSKSHPAMAR
jgi:acetyl esterase/lipase